MKTRSFAFINCIIGLLLLSSTLQAQFKIDAQLRNRFEIRDGYQKLAKVGDVPAIFVTQRTRLNFNYADERIRLRITPQDVRVWGGDQNVNATGISNNNNLGLYEGYAEVRLGDLGWVAVGRQVLKYDNQLLLGDRNWNQNGISYDALVFKLKYYDWSVHVGGSWNTLKETLSDTYYPSSRIKTQNFLWLNRKYGSKWNLSLMHLATGVTHSDTSNVLHFRQTSGVFTEYKGEALKLWGNVYYQYGHNTKGIKVSALLANADVCYSYGKVTGGAGFAYLSGSKELGTTQKTDGLFDMFYGNRHLYFGFMDYFLNFPTHTNQGGLVDYYVYLAYRPTKSISIRNIAHYFQLAQTNSLTPDDKNLGIENDLILTYSFNSWGALEAGYLFFLPTESLKVIQTVPNNKFSQFFYLQLTLSPVLFTQ